MLVVRGVARREGVHEGYVPPQLTKTMTYFTRFMIKKQSESDYFLNLISGMCPSQKNC